MIEHWSSRLGFALKDGEGPAELIDYFRVASDIIWRQEMGYAVEEELSEELANLRTVVRPFFQGYARPRRRRAR